MQVVYYHETDAVSSTVSGSTERNYHTMPEVLLTATHPTRLDSVFMVNTYVRSDETKVSGLVVSGYDKDSE